MILLSFGFWFTFSLLIDFVSSFIVIILLFLDYVYILMYQKQQYLTLTLFVFIALQLIFIFVFLLLLKFVFIVLWIHFLNSSLILSLIIFFTFQILTPSLTFFYTPNSFYLSFQSLLQKLLDLYLCFRIFSTDNYFSIIFSV